MLASLRALLSGIIDYAGLFPPAKLPLDQAVRNYARYRQEPDAWMLGRFICPAARLAELAPLAGELFRSGPPLVVAAPGRGGSTSSEFLAGLKPDLEDIAAFRQRHGERVVVDVLETRLPPEVVRSEQEAAAGLFAASGQLIESLGAPRLAPFFEIGLDPRWRVSVPAVVDALVGATSGRDPHGSRRPGGLKLRCGGLEAAAFPTPEQVAGVMAACMSAYPAAVPLKFTAGLHHPIRRRDPVLQVHAHGFLNIFCAGALAVHHHWDEGRIRAVLEDEDPASFRFDDEGLAWKDFRADLRSVEFARAQCFTSVGSCSFDEPRDDLRALGLLR